MQKKPISVILIFFFFFFLINVHIQRRTIENSFILKQFITAQVSHDTVVVTKDRSKKT